MTDLFLLSEAQMRRIERYFPRSHGVARVDDRRIVSAIVFVIRNGLRWRGLSGILCARPVGSSRLNEAFVEHDGELGLRLAPLARRHFPFSCGRAQDQIQELRRGVIGWKMTSRAHGTGNFALSASMALVV